ncbi:hypothetical protein A2U01_0052437 [Trifolium medium]|uniref:Uncharacterized protein n=1 Tax=Trifolium medium TaxID=97028 RepID=A0A392R6S1_9FABA|nr:hypothetical protein [Trifolium medium]
MWRNREIHDDNFHRPIDPMQQVLKITNDYYVSKSANNCVVERTRMLQNVGWKPPEEGRVKLNTDCACKDGRNAGCVCILRGSDG